MPADPIADPSANHIVITNPSSNSSANPMAFPAPDLSTDLSTDRTANLPADVTTNHRAAGAGDIVHPHAHSLIHVGVSCPCRTRLAHPQRRRDQRWQHQQRSDVAGPDHPWHRCRGGSVGVMLLACLAVMHSRRAKRRSAAPPTRSHAAGGSSFITNPAHAMNSAGPDRPSASSGTALSLGVPAWR